VAPAIKPDTPEGFPVIGIGASAGGLAAFEEFFAGMPPAGEINMAFVIVQHLDPDHKSILAELVKRYTRMQVFEASNGLKVQTNCTYIIPPNCTMTIVQGALVLTEPTAPRGQRLPIDLFFRSLAEEFRERAIGIVLSGTGCDGTLGLRAIKGQGGMVMAQTPETTEFDGMPRSAIATGMIDFILPPHEMAEQLTLYVQRAFQLDRPAPVFEPQVVESYKQIFALVRAQTTHDFSQYKPSTIARRIERRMAVHQIEQLEGYVRFLQQTPTEVEALFHDLLIGVTSFFRDPWAFAALGEKGIEKILAGKEAGASVRVWITGCSTGEEAYSIAILFQEAMETLKQSFRIQIFATDLDSRAIEHARVGVYPASVAGDIGADRMARFFSIDPESQTLRVNKPIRDMIIFSVQNLIKDPPFSRVDLISCRNLLIYLDGEVQKKLMLLFHYALNPDGVLFLGTSESVGNYFYAFPPLDRKAKVFQRLDDPHGFSPLSFSKFLPHSVPAAGRAVLLRTPSEKRIRYRELTEQALLQHVGVAAVLVNEHGDILYVHGRTGRYLEPAPGEADLNILNMAREGLQHELTVALRRVATQRREQCVPGLRVKTNGGYSPVCLTVKPIPAVAVSPEAPPLLLVILEEMAIKDFPEETPQRGKPGKQGKPGQASRTNQTSQTKLTGHKPSAAAKLLIHDLECELRDKESYLQTANEALATSNEELRSANEEMQSVNEELQSTNEELETSKEELQSVNEELVTVNSELQAKVTDLSQSNNDMNNLLAGTGVGMIFVNHQLLIQRFTPMITQVINLIATDVQRPIGHFVSNLIGYDTLVADVESVLDTLKSREAHVQTKSGAWFLLRIRPYRTLENVIEGAVITFFDITDLKKTQVQAENALASARSGETPIPPVTATLPTSKGEPR
jgi:two-component system CheB/CheR fusion protein